MLIGFLWFMGVNRLFYLPSIPSGDDTITGADAAQGVERAEKPALLPWHDRGAQLEEGGRRK